MYKSPSGEIVTCIFFATKTPPGIEWYGFTIQDENKNDTLYYGLIDSNKRDLGYFSLSDIKDFDAEYTSDPDVLNDITLPSGWERFSPNLLIEE